MTSSRGRPPWPPQVLIDLAAKRDPGLFELTPELVAAAADHRMTGLLWSWVSARHPKSELHTWLAMRDLRTQAHLKRLRALLEHCVMTLGMAGIEVASIKGPIAESRWYDRPGERHSSDVDLWLPPHQLSRAGEALKILQPDHPWVPFFDDLATARLVETVTLKIDHIEVDLHLDPLKIGVPTLQSGEIWAATEQFDLGDGIEVPVLDSETSLLLFLLHLNKDRFQRLLGYADIARIMDGGIDFGRFTHLAGGEGLLDVALCSLDAVLTDLHLTIPGDVPYPRSPYRQAWSMAWSRRIRLRGSEGRRRFRKRQLLIPILATGRLRETARCYALELAPPQPVLRERAAQHAMEPNHLRMLLARVWGRSTGG